MASRPERIRSLISRNIADIVRFELKNKSIGLVSVNEVVMNGDNSVANVYVTFLGAKHPKTALEELKKTEGYVRSSLAKKMDLYKVPKVRFVYDESFERALSIERKLREEGELLEAFDLNDEEPSK